MLISPMLDQGGLERVCALTGQLLKHNYDVYQVVFNGTGRIYDVSGVNYIDLQLGAVPGKIGKVCQFFKRISAVKKLKKKYNIQLSYSFSSTANIVNIATKVCDCVWVGIRGYGALDDKKRMAETCRKADRVICCSELMEQEIVSEFAPKSSAFFYNPCDLETIERLAREDVETCHKEFFERPGKTVISVGREHDVKGFWHLIKSFALLKEEQKEAKLVIVGAGEYTDYKNLAKDLGIEKDVLFTGVQSNPFAYMARADVYALTSDTEGFPNSLVEAMASGIPVVSVNCKTGPAEILGNNIEDYTDQNKVYHAEYGVLTPVFVGEKNFDSSFFTKEEQVFARELYGVLTNEEEYDKYKKASAQRAKSFGCDSYYQAISSLIDKDITV